MGRHFFSKKIAKAIRKGQQLTLPALGDTQPLLKRRKEPLPRLLTEEEAQALYHRLLAEIWRVPVETVRSRSWAMPVITYYK